MLAYKNVINFLIHYYFFYKSEVKTPAENMFDYISVS